MIAPISLLFCVMQHFCSRNCSLKHNSVILFAKIARTFMAFPKFNINVCTMQHNRTFGTNAVQDFNFKKWPVRNGHRQALKLFIELFQEQLCFWGKRCKLHRLSLRVTCLTKIFAIPSLAIARQVTNDIKTNLLLECQRSFESL